MIKLSPYGKPLASRTSDTDATSKIDAWDTATVAALKAIPSIDGAAATATTRPRHMLLAQGHEERVRSLNGRLFAWHPTCELDGDDQLVIIPNDRNSAVDTALADDLPGRWLAVPGQMVDLALAIAYTLADGATIYTMPTGSALFLAPGYWQVTTSWAGGSSSSIGIDSDQTGLSTAGDIHGGSGGDVAATLSATGGDGAGNYIPGTIGADVAAGAILLGGKLVRYQEITSAFTSGEGYFHLRGVLLANPGA
jgi:hypothetical protein